MSDPASEPNFLTALMKILDNQIIPAGYGQRMGFAMLIFPFDEKIEGRIDYASNADRKDMLTTMKEFIARAEGRIQETDTKQ